MFSPGSRRVEQKKTVFRHRLFFVLCFRERLMQGETAGASARRIAAHRPAVGGAQGGRPCRKSDGGEGKNMGGEPRRTFSLAEKEGGASCFFVRESVADGRSAELRSRRGGVFPKAQRILGAGIGDVPDRDPGSRAVRRAVACSERTRLFCLWNKRSALFLGRVGKYARVAPGNPAADRQGRKKKKMNKIAWLNVWQNFHH